MADNPWVSLVQDVRSSPRDTFVKRRQRMQQLMAEAGLDRAILASGLPQPRNFAHNLYPFRASSHFLYLVGEPLEAAVLSLGPDHAALYIDPPDPNASLWTGAQPTLGELADRLTIDVRPLEELEPGAETACAPPADALTTWWLSDLLDRSLEPAHGTPQSDPDARLAAVLIDLRLQHDAAAIEQMRQAVAVTRQAHAAAMRALGHAKTEFEVLAVMEAEIRRHGMVCAYQPIVTCHGEVLHNESYANTLAPRRSVACRRGRRNARRVGGRHHTHLARGRPVQSLPSATSTRSCSSRKGPPSTRYGPACATVTSISPPSVSSRHGLSQLGILRGPEEQLLRAGAAAVFFPTASGTSWAWMCTTWKIWVTLRVTKPGVSVTPDPTTRYLRLDRDLAPGMVVTIEPGFYQVPGLLAAAQADSVLRGLIDFDRLADFRDVRGIRIEDDVLVTQEGFEVLSEGLPKSVEDVEAVCHG